MCHKLISPFIDVHAIIARDGNIIEFEPNEQNWNPHILERIEPERMCRKIYRIRTEPNPWTCDLDSCRFDTIVDWRTQILLTDRYWVLYGSLRSNTSLYRVMEIEPNSHRTEQLLLLEPQQNRTLELTVLSHLWSLPTPTERRYGGNLRLSVDVCVSFSQRTLN